MPKAHCWETPSHNETSYMPRLPTVILAATWTATAGALTLTDDERSWLAWTIRSACDATWPPFEYRTANDIRAWLPITYAYPGLSGRSNKLDRTG